MATATHNPIPQHMQALASANEVRLGRAALKRQVAAGEVTVQQVLRRIPREAESMTIAELLRAQQRWGRQRAMKLLRKVNIAEARPLCALTHRQIHSLIHALDPATEARRLKAEGLYQHEIATALGVDQTKVSQLLRGEGDDA